MCHACLATTAFTLLPAGLGAEQLDLGMRSGISWNDNVYGASKEQNEEPVDDFSARLSPFATVSDPDGDLTWSLRYQPSYERYLSENDLSGLDHQASASVAWRFADRWSFQLNESYGIFQNPIRLNEATDPGDPVSLAFRNQEVRSNNTSAVLRHTLTPLDSVFLNLGYSTYQYPDGGGNDRGTPSASLVYQRLLSERTNVGARLSWSQQTYDRSGGEDSTQYYNLSATLEHHFSPTLRLEASAGPAFVDSAPVDEFESLQFAVASFRVGETNRAVALDASQCAFEGVEGRASINNFGGCTRGFVLDQAELDTLTSLIEQVPTLDEQGRPLDVSGSGGTDFTYFAYLALTKDWESWSASLSYDRSNSDSAAFGSSSVADTLRASVRWTPRRHWTFSLNAAASLQEQVSDQIVPNAYVLVNAPAPAGVDVASPANPTNQIAQVQSLVGSSEGSAEEYRTESVTFTANRQLTQHASVFASVYWYAQRQESGLVGVDAAHWENLTLWVGLDWAFHPITF